MASFLGPTSCGTEGRRSIRSHPGSEGRRFLTARLARRGGKRSELCALALDPSLCHYQQIQRRVPGLATGWAGDGGNVHRNGALPQGLVPVLGGSSAPWETGTRAKKPTTYPSPHSRTAAPPLSGRGRIAGTDSRAASIRIGARVTGMVMVPVGIAPFPQCPAEISVMASPTGKGSKKVIRELTPCGVCWPAHSRPSISFIINLLLTHLNFIQ
jgi:hypothetical protein